MNILVVRKMDESQIRKKIEAKLKLIAENKIYVFVSSPEYYHLVNNIILKYLTKKLKLNGIYVTLNIPYSQLQNSLKKHGTDISKLYFIDGISKKTSGKIPKADNCAFTSNPESLTELSLSITEKSNTGKFKFLFLDSISTLLIYHNSKTIEKFSHYMINKLRNANLSGVIMSLDEENSKKLIPLLSQFCDDCIYI
tara:strand:- start:905 stop:1492 length:588 start_codon:yes stop_codon:yes gene_type:complete